MKKIVLLLALVLTGLSLPAQVLWIHRGNTVITVPAAQTGEMTYGAEGTTLTIAGTTYAVSQIDSITVQQTAQPDSTVLINYVEGQLPRIFIPATLASLITTATDNAHVTLNSAQTGGGEVTYTLQGKSTDGSFTLNGSFKCTVELNGIALTSQRGSAIHIQNGKRIDVVMKKGTVNTLTDSENGTQKACFFVKGHPEFKGEGTLILYGNSRHAFASDEYTWIKKSAGRIEVRKALSDAFHCGQYFRMDGGDLYLAGMAGDGIQAEYTKDPTDEMNGQLLICSGKLTIELGGEDIKGLKCDSILTLSGGEISINVTGNGSKGISSEKAMYINQKTNPLVLNIQTSGGVYINPADPTDDSKCMGIRCKGDLHIDDGIIRVISTGTKGKSIKVDGVYYGPGRAQLEVSPAMEY